MFKTFSYLIAVSLCYCAISIAGALNPGADDFYERLGIHPKATQAEVNQQIRQIRIKIQLDAAAGGNSDLKTILEYGSKRITEALSTLESPRDRVKYDAKRSTTAAPPGPPLHEDSVKVAFLPKIQGHFPAQGLAPATLKWEEGANSGTLSYFVDTAKIADAKLPPFLLRTKLTVEGAVPLAEYNRIQGLSHQGTVGHLHQGDISFSRTERIDSRPKMVFDVSDKTPGLLVRVNATSGFEDSRRVVVAPPPVDVSSVQRFAYCPIGCSKPLPIEVLHTDGQKNKVYVADLPALEEKLGTEFEIGTVALHDLVWIASEAGYAQLRKTEHRTNPWPVSTLVTLPRTGDNQGAVSANPIVQSFLAARAAHGAPTYRPRTHREACGDAMGVVGRLAKRTFGMAAK